MFDLFLTNLLASHLAIAFAGAMLWIYRDVNRTIVSIIADILSVAALPAAFYFYIFFEQSNTAGKTAAPETLYLVFSVLTGGLLILFSVVTFWFFGRGVGRIIKLLLKRYA